MHEFRGDPHLRIALEVVVVGMGTEGHETRCRQRELLAVMTLLAGLKALVRVHL